MHLQQHIIIDPMENEWFDIKTTPVPFDIPVLVYLEKASLGSHVHSATFSKKGISIIGHHFDFDLPKPTHWMYQPKNPIS